MRVARHVGIGAVLAWCTALTVGIMPVAAQATVATAQVRTSDGRVVAEARFTQLATGVRVDVLASGLPTGVHGMHIHQRGICQPPAFESAGGHFNPLNRSHGLADPQGPHAGDLPNLVVSADGTARYSIVTPLITLGTGPTSIFDQDGSALVIHANADNQLTDPSGNSGTPIACGVIAPGTFAGAAVGGVTGDVTGAVPGAVTDVAPRAAVPGAAVPGAVRGEEFAPQADRRFDAEARSWLPLALLVVVLLIAAGAAAWFAYSRRGRTV